MADHTLTDAQNGGQFTVHVGDTIAISLPENSAAGYRWSVASLDETRVAVTSQRYQATSTAVGSAGMALWTLTAKAAGTAHVALKKSRPWEPAEAATERFEVDLHIVR